MCTILSKDVATQLVIPVLHKDKTAKIKIKRKKLVFTVSYLHLPLSQRAKGLPALVSIVTIATVQSSDWWKH